MGAIVFCNLHIMMIEFFTAGFASFSAVARGVLWGAEAPPEVDLEGAEHLPK